MATLDLLARASTITLLVVVSVVLLRGLRGSAFAWTGSAFFSTVSAYLVLTAPAYSPPPGLHLALSALAFASPAAFWIFSGAFFDEDSAVTTANIAITTVFIAIGFLETRLDLFRVLYYVATVAIVVVALARVFRGRPADLVEPRRRLRTAFTVVVGIEIVIVVSADLFFGASQASMPVQLVRSMGALWLTMVFGAWLLAPRAELLPLTQSAPLHAPLPPIGDDDRFRNRLLTLMENEQVYRREGLTIRSLAAQLDIPEYRLRRVINQQLGYRNFNTFVNHFRIEEACRILADPAHERMPILNLALDLGFGSLGPFNRAFRARIGQTPTEYRRARLAGPPRAAAEDRNHSPNVKIATKL